MAYRDFFDDCSFLACPDDRAFFATTVDSSSDIASGAALFFPFVSLEGSLIVNGVAVGGRVARLLLTRQRRTDRTRQDHKRKLASTAYLLLVRKLEAIVFVTTSFPFPLLTWSRPRFCIIRIRQMRYIGNKAGYVHSLVQWSSLPSL